jgi:hypothetical protein
MNEFIEQDVNVISTKLTDGRREIGLIHVPTGLSVAGYVKNDESSLRTKERLMNELKEKVAAASG